MIFIVCSRSTLLSFGVYYTRKCLVSSWTLLHAKESELLLWLGAEAWPGVWLTCRSRDPWVGKSTILKLLFSIAMLNNQMVYIYIYVDNYVSYILYICMLYIYNIHIYIYIHTIYIYTYMSHHCQWIPTTAWRSATGAPSQGAALPAPRSKAWLATWAKSRMSWEHWQTIGKPWENHRKMVVEWDLIGYLVGG